MRKAIRIQAVYKYVVAFSIFIQVEVAVAEPAEGAVVSGETVAKNGTRGPPTVGTIVTPNGCLWDVNLRTFKISEI